MSLIASNLCLKPDTEHHLNDVCFEMSKGEIYTIIGRTLAGKTTLLKTIAGLIAPESGSLTLDGRILVAFRCGSAKWQWCINNSSTIHI
jgi:glycerol transport system ATP-binding protein